MIVGTRGSRLALRQTEMFMDAARAHMNEEMTVREIRSSGDVDTTTPIWEMQGYGAFVRELDAALVKGEIDVSVNSLKDVPINNRSGTVIGAVMRRDAVEDAILPVELSGLPIGAKVGTSSKRRMSILRRARPDLDVVPLRGNIHTRLDRLDSGEMDAIILAKAGIDRMGIVRSHNILPVHEFVPAPAQGAIGIACRADDDRMLSRLSKLDDAPTRMETDLERRIMSMMGAGCTSPIGINARLNGGSFRVRAISFEHSDDPCLVDETLNVGYNEDDLTSIVSKLRGE